MFKGDFAILVSLDEIVVDSFGRRAGREAEDEGFLWIRGETFDSMDDVVGNVFGGGGLAVANDESPDERSSALCAMDKVGWIPMSGRRAYMMVVSDKDR
jgi:hypothetical protein